jgi:CRP/FNR family transcriptional regulator
MTFDQLERPSALASPRAASTSARSGGAREEKTPKNAGRQIHFAPRSLIFLEGDRADAVHQIVSGSAMLYKLLPDGRRQVVEILGPGDVFGFSPTAVHDVSAETLTAVRCTVFERAEIERSPVLLGQLTARLYAQLRALHEHIMLLGRKSAIERIASFLMRCLPGRGGPECAGPPRVRDRADVRLAMTRYGIADYLGLTIETVSRSFARLKRRGIVSVSKIDEVCIHDVCALCRMTGTHPGCDSPQRRAIAGRHAGE